MSLRPDELIVDNFAGGGGASTGIVAAAKRPVDIAINHNAEAIAMHAINHPETRHLCEDVFEADLAAALGGRKIGGAWYSPDCTYFSAARGGKPIRKEGKRIRGLSLVILKHARNPATRPRVFFLENVREFQHWGPLDESGKPCKKRKGVTFRLWWKQLERLGCNLEMRELRGCDYGAPTIRKRLFIIGRFDGLPINWPEPTHGDPKSEAVKSGKLEPWRTSAECIDFSLPCRSIFGRKRSLAFNTERRIAKGFMRYVADDPNPFIVTCNHGGEGFRGQSLREPFKTLTAARDAHGLVMPYLARIGQTGGNGNYSNSVAEPLTTITSKAEHCLIVPYLAGVGGRMGQSRPRGANEPMQTVTAKADTVLITAYLAKNYGGVIGHKLDRPLGTVTTVDHHSLVTSHLIKLKGTCQDGQRVTDPMPTVQAGGLHVGVVNSYLIKYYGADQDPRLDEPMHTITSKHRFGLCETASVHINGLTPEQIQSAEQVARFFEKYLPERFQPPDSGPRPSMVLMGDYVVVDIGLRMLKARELYLANGFPPGYIIEFDFQGKRLSEAAQVRMCGNAVPPPFSEALWNANLGEKSLRSYERPAKQMGLL